MLHTKYLIVGSSHAGLAAADAIRMRDEEGLLTLVTQENSLPYSPTILPYIVAGKVDPEKVFLRGQLIVEGDEWKGRRGMGQFLRRGEGIFI